MVHEHKVHDSDARFKIDPITRAIKNESQKKILLIQGDHNSEVFSFSCPRYIEGHDMSDCNRVEVHFFNINTQSSKTISGKYEAQDLQVSAEDENTVEFSWIISGNGTQLQGRLEFLVRFKCVEEDLVTYAWNTAFYTGINIGMGSDVDETFETQYVDIIDQWKSSVLDGFAEEFTEWKEQTDTRITADIGRWKEEAFDDVDAYLQEHAAQWDNGLANANKQIGFLSNYVTPQMFGAKGDGVTDDTEAVQAALNSERTVVLPVGNYNVSTVTVPYGVIIYGENKDGSVLMVDRVNLTTHNTLSNFTIKASENAIDMVMISAENADSEYAQIVVQNMRFKGSDSKEKLPNMITLEVSTDYKCKGLYGITFQNIVSNGYLNNAFLFRHVFNLDENVWFTNVDISNIFILSALCAMKQEIVWADGVTRQSPLQGFRVNFLNMQNNIGFTKSLFDLYYINQSMFDGCELWDKTDAEDSYIIRNTLSRITILNDRTAGYIDVLTVPDSDKSYRELFNTIICGYTSQARNSRLEGYKGEVIAPTDDRNLSTAPSMPLFNAVCFTNANTTINGAKNHFFGAEYFSPNRIGTASIAGVLGFTSGKCPVFATRTVNDDEYVLQYLYSEAYMPNGTSENRPKDSNIPAGYIPVGYMYFDRTLGKPIWRNSNGQWVDANGTVV